MLIHALCDYYDILAKEGKVLPEGYSSVKIHYLISLTEDGRMDRIINHQDTVQVPSGKKMKKKEVPKDLRMPKRTEKSGIDANIAEHRPLYIFGLNLDKDILTPDDRTSKAKKSHQAFVEANLDFIEGLHSPLIDAFRAFLMNWEPEDETENLWLLGLGKNYGKSGYAFCLSGHPECLLHEEKEFKEKWEQWYQDKKAKEKDSHIAQDAISGEQTSIARIHNKIKGVYGGLATGSVLVGFNNPSENSYGNEQSYNSNISETAMNKYTEALNYLLSSDRHKVLLDDMTVVFWAMDTGEACENLLMDILLGQSDKMKAEQTERMLAKLFQDAGKGTVGGERLTLDGIDENVDFYMMGLKPNSSRLSLKFLVRKKYADILWNIARFQNDLQMGKEFHSVSIMRIKRELLSQKSKNEKVNPALLSSLMESMINGTRLPVSLMENVLRRVKADPGDQKVNAVRAGIIKAWINRASKKEELKVALDRENYRPAYLCGRLFAVLEKIQQEASGNSLNRTIKDGYFASASARPSVVFPKLIRLSQYHLNKVKSPVYFNKLTGEIIGHLDGGFPDTLFLKEQGEFIVGYYQQYQSFFEKKNKEEDKNGSEQPV
ncbi:type I-C CRISPR-associated protein Cas8c/Csd1 [Eubacterium sp. An11]|uniref:type I-C CRISPR-associated protein Cas8c/Csd1 n=1 Tax=Eubacterium sp. An11 TaxID=1965542 RepID=UPI000B39AE15|nr:type I-C CRISPR-associated protein Cas8c/Csd1 [Eubacterium sp. An11]OUQ69214.1 type I-C CRISPR-associated protein Cas8c/Csd1 [Eubacterium sp. An11]